MIATAACLCCSQVRVLSHPELLTNSTDSVPTRCLCNRYAFPLQQHQSSQKSILLCQPVCPGDLSICRVSCIVLAQPYLGSTVWFCIYAFDGCKQGGFRRSVGAMGALLSVPKQTSTEKRPKNAKHTSNIAMMRPNRPFLRPFLRVAQVPVLLVPVKIPWVQASAQNGQPNRLTALADKLCKNLLRQPEHPWLYHLEQH